MRERPKAPMRALRILVVSGAAIALDVSALAQDAGRAIELDEITVTLPSRDARSLQETPAAVTVVDEDEATRRQASTAEELLGDVPGLSLDGGPRGIAQEPNIRGFQDEQVVIRLDGARQNFNVAHRGRFFIDPDIIQRAEVLKGGSSALYGSGAIGGVIGLRTKSAKDLLEPGQTMGARLKTGYASNGGEAMGSATVYAAEGGFDALAFFALRDRQDDIEDGFGDPIRDSKIDSRNMLGKLGWEVSDDLRFEFHAQYYADDGRTPNAADNATSTNSLVERDIEVQSYRLKAKYAPSGSDLINLDATAYYNLNDLSERRLNVDGYGVTEFRTIGLDVVNRSNVFLGAPFELAYGFEFYRDEQEGERSFSPVITTGFGMFGPVFGLADYDFPDASLTSIGVFAQADIKLSPALTATPGVRFDYVSIDPESVYQDRTESELSPKLALAYKLSQDATLWGSASRSFRAPSLTELYQDGTHFVIDFGGAGVWANTFVPNPNLQSERADQLEAGVRLRFGELFEPGDTLRLEANAYYSRVDDYIDTLVTVQGPGGVNTTENFNVDAELWGFEGEVKYDVGMWFVGLSGSLPRGHARSGGALGSLPQDKATLSLGYRPVAALELGGRTTFRDKQDNLVRQLSSPSPTSGSTVIDIYSAFQPTDGPLRGVVLTAGVDNLTDDGYAIHPTGDLNQPGRTFKFTGAVKF